MGNFPWSLATRSYRESVAHSTSVSYSQSYSTSTSVSLRSSRLWWSIIWWSLGCSIPSYNLTWLYFKLRMQAMSLIECQILLKSLDFFFPIVGTKWIYLNESSGLSCHLSYLIDNIFQLDCGLTLLIANFVISFLMETRKKFYSNAL